MTDFLSIMFLPFVVCLIFAGIHSYLGHHVILRQIIFVDLALAQIAVLGAGLGIIWGYDTHHPLSYWLTLGFAMAGALLLSLTRTRNKNIPQEAIIGVIYAVAAGLLILVLSRTGEGGGHIQQMLTGNILLVSKGEVIKCFLLYSLIGVIHLIFKDKFISISEGNYPKNRRHIILYDIVFYLTFAIVITSSVRVAGVLVVFSFLIAPPLAAMLLTNNIRLRILLGWLIGFAGGVLGLAISYFGNFPTGASIICAFGLILLAISLCRRTT